MASTDCEFDPCPTLFDEPLVDTPVEEEPAVPSLMLFWAVVPLIDLSTGIYNYNRFNDSYQHDFMTLEIVEFMMGFTGLGVWAAGAFFKSPLFAIDLYSKAVVGLELGAMAMTYYAWENVVYGSEDYSSIGYILHTVALYAAGAAILPIHKYVIDSRNWKAAQI